MPQQLRIYDRGFSSMDDPLEQAIYNEISANPDVHDPRTLIMALAGATDTGISAQPTDKEYSRFRETERRLRFDPTNPDSKDAIDNRYISINGYFNDVLLVSDKKPTMADFLAGCKLAYRSIDDKLPENVSPEDKGRSIARHRYWAEKKQETTPTWYDTKHEQELEGEWLSKRRRHRDLRPSGLVT